MNKDKILTEFRELVAVQSVSTDPARYGEVLKAADILVKKLENLGFAVKLLKKENKAPLLFAKKIVKGAKKTIGIYGHYDVQPEDPIEEWKTKPFELIIRDGKIWGRGTADNKGHVIQNIAAIEELITQNSLTHNVIFLLEGEEEIGSEHLEEYINEVKDDVSQADVFYVTDVGMHAKNEPYIFYALRGVVSFELEVSIGERDLHSGEYGNRVYNAINVLADMIAKIKDVRTGRIMIPGFYDDVRTLDEKELELLKAIEKSDEEEQQEANTYTVTSLNEKYPHLSSKIYPSFDVNGIIGGYTGPGGKTIIPRKASCKFSIRLVEHQGSDKVQQTVKKFIEDNLPKGVKYILTSGGKAPFYTSIDNEYIQKTAKLLEEAFGNKIRFNRAGGSIPVAEVIQRVVQKPVVLTGFTLPDDRLHSPNENFDEEMFWKGIEALKKIYSTI